MMKMTYPQTPDELIRLAECLATTGLSNRGYPPLFLNALGSAEQLQFSREVNRARPMTDRRVRELVLRLAREPATRSTAAT